MQREGIEVEVAEYHYEEENGDKEEIHINVK